MSHHNKIRHLPHEIEGMEKLILFDFMKPYR